MNDAGREPRAIPSEPYPNTAETPVCSRGHRKDGSHHDRVRCNLPNLDDGAEATPWWVRDWFRREHARSRRGAA